MVILKKLVKFFIILLVGALIGAAVLGYYYIKPLNQKMARINETQLIAQVDLLEQLQKEDIEQALKNLNASIDLKLLTAYHWTLIEKGGPSDDALRAINKVAELRQEKSYQLSPEVETALQKLRSLQESSAVQ